jgi:hypothetical protein
MYQGKGLVAEGVAEDCVMFISMYSTLTSNEFIEDSVRSDPQRLGTQSHRGFNRFVFGT